jgi:hypothetical protein
MQAAPSDQGCDQPNHLVSSVACGMQARCWMPLRCTHRAVAACGCPGGGGHQCFQNLRQTSGVGWTQFWVIDADVAALVDAYAVMGHSICDCCMQLVKRLNGDIVGMW